MDQKKIYKLIKTECGQAKYEALILNKTFLGKIRLYWFIFFATIKDINIKNQSSLDSFMISFAYLAEKYTTRAVETILIKFIKILLLVSKSLISLRLFAIPPIEL